VSTIVTVCATYLSDIVFSVIKNKTCLILLFLVYDNHHIFSAKKHIVGRIEINNAIVSQSLDIRTILKHNNKILFNHQCRFVATFRI